jgi:hypothetical protein
MDMTRGFIERGAKPRDGIFFFAKTQKALRFDALIEKEVVFTSPESGPTPTPYSSTQET